MRVLHKARLSVKDDPSESSSVPFKICNMCLTVWPDAKSFISDRSLTVNGYQAYFDNPEEGLILFTHKVKGCGSTLALRAGVFKPFYHGPELRMHNLGKPSCCGHCLQQDNLEQCGAECDMHWVRDILQLLRRFRAS